MGLVLWIDQNTFASSLIEKAFKKKDLAFYTVPRPNDFAYLIQDLNPEVLVLDAETLLTDVEAVKVQYEGSHKFAGRPVIILDPKPGLEFIENKIGELKRPLDPFQVHNQIRNLLNN